jgi:hypothetical protein
LPFTELRGADFGELGWICQNAGLFEFGEYIRVVVLLMGGNQNR